MSRPQYTEIWRGRNVVLERSNTGDLYVNDHVIGVRLPISHNEARVLAAVLARETSPSKGKRFTWPWQRTMRQNAGDGSVQIQIGNWPKDRR